MPVTRDNLQEVFKYHAPKEGQPEQYEAIRKAGYEFANAILTLTPSCADQQAALRLVREACMTANAAVALEGKI